MLIAVCAVILVLFAALPCTAADAPLSLFRQANTLYEKGQYTDAIGAYEALAAQNQGNAALYYNLGNAYYRQGRMGKALLNYERARRLDPRDRDINDNLKFVRQQTKEPQPGFSDVLRDALSSFATLNELTVLCSFCFTAFIGGCILRLFYRRRRVTVIAGAAGLAFMASLSLLLVKLDAETWTSWGIVTAGPVEIRNGPGMENSVGFTLPEGRKVMLLGENAGWTAVGLSAEGLRGWIEKKFIESI